MKVQEYLKALFSPAPSEPTPETLGRVRPYQFKVLEDFRRVINGCMNEYHAGHTYTVRVGEVYNELDRCIDRWIAEGKVIGL